MVRNTALGIKARARRSRYHSGALSHMTRRRVYKLETKPEPRTVIDRSFATRQEAVTYAESIFLLHPDEAWQETFRIVEVDE